jgi:hypothetical protein
VRLVRETAEAAVFSFRPQPGSGLGGRRGEGAVPESVTRHLVGELMVEVASPIVSSFRIYSNRSFKPNPAARLDELDIEMELGETEPGGPIAVVATRTRIAGSALFNSFEQTITVVNSSFVRSDGAPQAAP